MANNEKNTGRFRSVKAYKNEAFMGSPDARVLRILSEYIEPASRFEDLQVRDTIVIFGSARILPRDKAQAALDAARASGEKLEQAQRAFDMSHYYECTRELSRRLTEWSKSLDTRASAKPGDKEERRFVICSGGGPGIMEAANRGASEAKGVNIGLNIALPFEQEVNPWITRRLAFEFHYFFMRKYWFAYLAKGIVAMPGGFGTLDEFMEVVTLIQTLKIKKKLPIVLFGTEYWDEIINFEAMAKWGMINHEDIALFHRTNSVDDAFEYMTRELRHYLNEPQPEEGIGSPIKRVPAAGSIDAP